MATVRDERGRFPHIGFREVLGQQEAYLPGTGLSVWEVAWLDRVHHGDGGAVADHLSISPELIEEALRYARSYPSEIEPALQVMEEASEERLRSILPGLRVIDVDVGTSRLGTS